MTADLADISHSPTSPDFVKSCLGNTCRVRMMGSIREMLDPVTDDNT
jgi:hypothetical protein